MPRASVVAVIVAACVAGGCRGSGPSAPRCADSACPDAASAPDFTFADLRWRVRCERMATCPGHPDRCILGFDGDTVEDCGTTFVTSVSCSVTETATTRTLSFDVSGTTPTETYGLAITGAVVPRAGGAAGGACSVAVLEGSSMLAGACGASAPSAAQPCQITNVTFSSDPDGRTLITGSLLCVDLSPDSDPTIDREVTAPGNEPVAAVTPLTFSLYDCPGLGLP